MHKNVSGKNSLHMKIFPILRCYYKKRLSEKFKRKTVVQRVDEKIIDMLLSQHSSSSVFIHAGLSAISSGLGIRNATEWIIKKFSSFFQVLLVPGFTPSFRTSGIYHKFFSLPEYGMLSRQFLANSNSRTDDPIHSILIHGNYSFTGCRHDFSFGYESCFDKLDSENTLIVNIGTRDIVFAQLHHIERVYEVPYIMDRYHKGIIYYDETNFSKINQRNYMFMPNKLTWNRNKIRRDLISDGVLTEHNLNGLIIRFFRAREMREALGSRINKNPYYLIS